MLSKSDTLFSKTLVDKGLISAETLRPYLDEASKSKENLLSLLLKKGDFSEENLLRSISEALKIPFVEQYQLKSDPSVVEKVPLKIAEYYKIVPLKLEKKKLTVAVSSPLDLRTQDDIRAHLGYEVEMILARQKDIAEALKKAYGFAAGTIGEMVERQATPSAEKLPAQSAFDRIESIDNLEKMAGDATIAKLVNQIIVEAYHRRATDIHIEPYRGKVKLRYRIDGVLYNANVPGEISRFILPVLSRVKIMANLNIVEKRLPQDGRAIVKVEDAQLDLRVSSIPTPYGESVVIRLLPMNRVFDLKKLGLNPKQLQVFDTLINKPHGVIFITGPTGSGKSTTLYACLNNINTDERKIITIEDPVEYEMEGVTQIQVASNIGLDFARGLRSMLRHDPDVMMVGEVRDLETAEMAIRVALTGHLVFSTLHTNDAASGITRLVDIGIQPYLVASSVDAFIAQRLIRVVCTHCKEEDKAFPNEIKERIAKEMKMLMKDVKVYHGKGCNECNFTGFWGRLAIYEILLVTELIKQMIMRRQPSGDIKREAVAHGMRTLRQDGWQKVILGLTTPSEIFEATPADADTEPDENEETEFIPAVKSMEVPAHSLVTSEKTSDRRIFSRLSANVNVGYRLIKNISNPDEIDESTPETEAVTKDIGAGGLAFFLKETIAKGSILELRIELPGQKEPIKCLAKVLRYQSIEGTPFFETTVYFLDLSGRDRQLLEKYVEKGKK
jgi:type II secretory ATPase GspE/PulE/Tfp pilus assembly ATPase PilB-like protein